MAEEIRVSPSEDERDVERQGEIGLLSNVLGNVNEDVVEIEVDPITPTQNAAGQRSVVVRVNRPIEEMSFSEGTYKNGKQVRPVQHYDFKEGHQYQVPVAVARELEAIGALWH